MEQQLSDVLDNVLGLLLLEGSYDVEETDDEFNVKIETQDAGRLIGFKGESLDSLQLLINLIMLSKNKEQSKRVVIDAEGWREKKSQDLQNNAIEWAHQVKETGKEMDLEPMSAWQRRLVHLAVESIEGIETESIGEGRDRHLVIRPQIKTN